MIDRLVTCAVCGQASKLSVLQSVTLRGQPDLDGRRGRVTRESWFLRIQRCRGCGYCAHTIARAHSPAVIRQVLATDAYRRQLTDPGLPELACEFLCSAMLEEAMASPENAGKLLLEAAWALDDAQKAEAARDCRRRAAAMLAQARQQQRRFDESELWEGAVLVDILRRAGEFDKAREIIHGLPAASPGTESDANATKVIRFEQELIDRSDVEPHNRAEVIVLPKPKQTLLGCLLELPMVIGVGCLLAPFWLAFQLMTSPKRIADRARTALRSVVSWFRDPHERS